MVNAYFLATVMVYQMAVAARNDLRHSVEYRAAMRR
jgi:hypothetical protein